MERTSFLIGQMLVAEKLITEGQLAEALAAQKHTGQKLGQVLIEQGYVSDVEFTKMLARRLKTAYVDLENMQLKPSVVNVIPQSFARKHTLVAIDQSETTLFVAMSDPVNFFVIEDLRFMTNLDISTSISTEFQIKRAIDEYYVASVAREAAKDVNKEFSVTLPSHIGSLDALADERVDNAPVVRLVNSIILQAARMGASDIHIEPTKADTKVRMRIDGHLRDVLTLDGAAHASLITRVKIMSSMNIAERRVPLDGRCEFTLEGVYVDLRISTVPTVYGEKAVARLLNNSLSRNITSKSALGLSARNQPLFEKLIQLTRGVILVTGPTGSGKTTTLYTIISEIISPEINIVTIEDPVEYKIDGANQMQINTKAGLTFASGLRAILRQDPDVIMVGEIRDGETASIAVRAAITGHLVLSTVHTNDAVSTVGRLVDMGVVPYLVSSAVAAIIAQRLVRRVCSNCKRPYQSSESENAILEISESVTLYKGEGCAQCNSTGYKGRTAIHEIVLIDDAMRDMITRGENASVLWEHAFKRGTSSLKQDMIGRVLNGDSTVDELIAATYTL